MIDVGEARVADHIIVGLHRCLVTADIITVHGYTPSVPVQRDRNDVTLSRMKEPTGFSHSVTRSLPWARHQRRQAKDDVAQHPEDHDGRHAQGGADRRARLFGFGCEGVKILGHAAQSGHQPCDHGDVEQDERPFEQDAEKSAFRFAQGVAAMRAIEGFFGNLLVAAFAGDAHGAPRDVICGLMWCLPLIEVRHDIS